MSAAPAAAAAALAVLAALALALPGDAQALRTAPACTGHIDALPAVISSRGRWCLRRNLSTAITGGAGIQIDAHDVTIDCDRYGVDGTPGGDASTAVGIRAVGRDNVRVERCLVRGFRVGIGVGGDGMQIHDNHVDLSKRFGIDVAGAAGVVDGNRILDVGGNHAPTSTVTGLRARGTIDVLDNVVWDLRPRLSDPYATEVGMDIADNAGGLVRGNVLDLSSKHFPATSFGLRLATSPGAIVRGNHVLDFDVAVACDGPAIVVVDNLLLDADVVEGCTVRGAVAAAAHERVAVPPMPVATRRCDGWIDALPATITKAGNYCLRRDVTTQLASGAAVLVEGPRVSIDCRGFRISGPAPGTPTTATGFRFEGPYGAVRNCALRRFARGIHFDSSSNDFPVAEYNRLEGVRRTAIEGHSALVRHNDVFDTTSLDTATAQSFTGIIGYYVIDNRVERVGQPAPTGSDQYGRGIGAVVAAGNRVRDIVAANAGTASGIHARAAMANEVSGAATGIACPHVGGDPRGTAGGNTLVQTPQPLATCDDSGNRVVP